ncbi:hypothetical protein KZ498_11180 [Haloarcula sp. 1CSR25-25]|nr:hypothetical protein [Haloarcula sp. 1CSR25-25]
MSQGSAVVTNQHAGPTTTLNPSRNWVLTTPRCGSARRRRLTPSGVILRTQVGPTASTRGRRWA